MFVKEEQLVAEEFGSVLHYVASGVLFPEGEVLPDFVFAEEGDLAESVEHFYFALPFLNGHEGGFAVEEVGYALKMGVRF